MTPDSDQSAVTLGHVHEAIEAAHWAFEELSEARTLGEQGAAYERLSNAMHDLVSWHPLWDYERGVLGPIG